uniref:Uncharacterized protein n=1 Tax=Rhizophora mucronata TaxID=61149 RepID=A0A2P2PS28_RHIMU
MYVQWISTCVDLIPIRLGGKEEVIGLCMVHTHVFIYMYLGRK